MVTTLATHITIKEDLFRSVFLIKQEGIITYAEITMVKLLK